MIICLRNVVIPKGVRTNYLKWIRDGKDTREAHGLIAEWVLEPSVAEGDAVVITVWPSHEVFDAWIATPERDALTNSDIHQSVVYRPITRYDFVGGYTNIAGLSKQNQLSDKEAERK